ncbi:hypothetical protein BBJ29_008752 [Phytophthora kernoviae]|uniref:CSC1/OSCA1-like 7TM region domain-containing protein n=1 Tax=Phytophthora kernoviae TaxID=325452 RepID=A0A3F2RCT3_9STRA|nr:hypothetical protein BBJ29_008752 [Phytophthora kernoviae]RLN53290.1 hypothetical protein BBP00_00009352 [Phytophthora kernoviae]
MADAASAADSIIDEAAKEDLTPSTTILDGMRVYFVIGAIGWLCFELGRIKLQRAYYCREDKPETTNRAVTRCHDARVLGWLKFLLLTSDDEILEQCGMDTLFFLRFLRICEKVTCVAVLCSVANFPIYYYAQRDDQDALYKMTLSHLDTDETWRFWFTVVTMYLVSLTTCFLLWKEYQEYIHRRHEFMSRKHSQQYTVCLNGLPPNLCTQQTLRNYLELLFPKSVLHVYVALECGDLEKLVAERVKVRNRLEHVLAQMDASLLNKLVIYQIYVTFLLPIIGGTVIDTVMGKGGTDWTDVSAVLTKISDAVAVQSSFFITYLLVRTGLNLTLVLLRVTPIIKAAIYHYVAPKLTPRERTTPWFGLNSLAYPGDFSASDLVSEYYLVLMLVLVFCAIAPILNYFALVYLLLSDLVYRWAVMCVHDPSTQTAGTFFPSLYRFIIGALMFSQIIMASVLATKQVALPATFSIILPFITFAFHVFVSSRYPKIALYLPLDKAVIVDSRRSRQMDDLESVLEDTYLQPAMLERGPLEPDYQGLTSDPNTENQLASPPPVEKDSFRSQDKQIFSPKHIDDVPGGAYERMDSKKRSKRPDQDMGGLV